MGDSGILKTAGKVSNFTGRHRFYPPSVLYYVKYPKLVSQFRLKLGHWPSLLFPITHNEKMQWRKLFERDPRIIRLTDKLLCKQYFAATCPDLRVVDPLWTGVDAREIPDRLLAMDVVVKTNHASGFNIFVRREQARPDFVRKTVNRWLRRTYGASRAEWAYSQIEPRVFVEPLLKSDEIFDIYVEVFDGYVSNSFVMMGKTSGNIRIGLFDAEGARLSGTTYDFLDPNKQIASDFTLPDCYHEAIAYARILGQGFDYVRVDFMCDGGAVYGGEMTFYSVNGFGNIFTNAMLYHRISRAWDLRKSWFLKTDQRGWRRRYAESLRHHAGWEQELEGSTSSPVLVRHHRERK